MIHLSLIGNGNLGSNLCRAFSLSSTISLEEVVDRKAEKGTQLHGARLIRRVEDMKAVDLCLLAVPDDQIASVADRIPAHVKLIAHCSGAAAMDDLPFGRAVGVWYPLQSFSRGRKVDLSQVPICIESREANDLSLLRGVGEAVSDHVIEVNSQQRAALHLAAVWVNNFVNHLYTIAASGLKANDLTIELLRPLMKETLSKIEEMPPALAQTGPAKRGDHKTIEKHLSMLDGTEFGALYRQLSESIIYTHGDKL